MTNLKEEELHLFFIQLMKTGQKKMVSNVFFLHLFFFIFYFYFSVFSYSFYPFQFPFFCFFLSFLPFSQFFSFSYQFLFYFFVHFSLLFFFFNLLGGCLDLFGVDQNNDPTEIVKSIVPKRNTLLFFEVGITTWHQVAEVLANRNRMSISGNVFFVLFFLLLVSSFDLSFFQSQIELVGRFFSFASFYNF